MKTTCLPRESCGHETERSKSCGTRPETFGNMRLVEGEGWRDVKFLGEDAKLCGVLIVAKTEPEPYRNFYVRRWDHPYEPNFETRTYTLLAFCQQDKVKKYIESGKAGNLLVWTRDEKTKKPYFIGAYEGIQKLRNIEGMKDGEWGPRVALMVAEVYILPYDKRLAMKDFESEFRKRDPFFPCEGRICPFQSRYGHYVVDKELTRAVMKAIRKDAVESKVYANLGEYHTQEMLTRQREVMKLNKRQARRINIKRFRERSVTKLEMLYAKKMGIL